MSSAKEERYFRLLWGAHLRALRLYRGWSQAKVAKKAKTTQAHIARIENGRVNVSARTLEKLITALRGRLQLEIAPAASERSK